MRKIYTPEQNNKCGIWANDYGEMRRNGIHFKGK